MNPCELRSDGHLFRHGSTTINWVDGMPRVVVVVNFCEACGRSVVADSEPAFKPAD